jgi:predicted Ser/Thr protein kinase
MEFFAGELGKVTRNFNRSTVIGKGGYGTVYKGEVRHQMVAIKVLTQVF